MAPSIEVSVVLRGDPSLDAAHVTRALGLQPTQIWRTPKFVAAQHQHLDAVEWRWELATDECQFEKAIVSLLDVFVPKSREVRALVEQGWKCSVHLVPNGALREFVPVLTRQQIKALAELGAMLIVSFDRLEE